MKLWLSLINMGLAAGLLLLVAAPGRAQQPTAPAKAPLVADSAAAQPTTHQVPLPDSVARPSLLRRSAAWAAQPARRGLLAPVILLSAGALTTRKLGLVNSDEALRDLLRAHVGPVRTSLDNQLRYAPAVAAIGLSVAGVRGQHSPVNQALLYALAYLINNTLTSNLKHLTHVERPRGQGDYSSFPSQHTSAAFAAARLLDREYGARSGWYSASGYAVATGVAALRVLKDNHWLSDVLAGAGVGLASTELAYAAYPLLHRLLLKGLQDRALVLPFYQSGETGLSAVLLL